MRQRLFRTLAPVASERYQDRYIRHATADEYELPGELAHDVWSFLETIVGSEVSSRAYSSEDLARFEALCEMAKAVEDWVYASDQSYSSLLSEDQWLRFRAEARRIMAEMKLGDLAAWEEAEIRSAKDRS